MSAFFKWPHEQLLGVMTSCFSNLNRHDKGDQHLDIIRAGGHEPSR